MAHPQNEAPILAAKFGFGATIVFALAFWLFGETGVAVVAVLGTLGWFALLT